MNVQELTASFHVGKMFRSPFVKSMAVVMSGTAVAQIVGFCLMPVISRLFSPSAFGLYGAYSSIVIVLSACVTLQYSQAVMLPKREEDAFNLMVISLISTVVISALTLFAVLLFPEPIKVLLKTNSKTILYLMPVSLFVSGVNLTAQAWCVRVKSFRMTSFSNVIRSVVMNGIQVLLGLFRSTGLALIAGTIVADMVASINLLHVVKKSHMHFRSTLQTSQLIGLAHEYRDFPLYSAPQNLINALSQGLPILLLSHYYDISVAGIYAFGVRILQVPMNFVLRALRQVLFQKACETYNYSGNLFPLYLKITIGLIVMAVCPAVILIVWAPPIFELVFGSEWLSAGILARWLTLWLTMAFCNVPSILFARILRMQKHMFWYEIILLVSRVGALIYGGMKMGYVHTIILYSVVGSIMNISLIAWVGVVLSRNNRNIEFSNCDSEKKKEMRSRIDEC